MKQTVHSVGVIQEDPAGPATAPPAPEPKWPPSPGPTPTMRHLRDRLASLAQHLTPGVPDAAAQALIRIAAGVGTPGAEEGALEDLRGWLHAHGQVLTAAEREGLL